MIIVNNITMMVRGGEGWLHNDRKITEHRVGEDGEEEEDGMGESED